ncbi:2-C-methyl-D-erythritol 4-phosphate cytidylyltransferase [Pseudonocardia sp. GCM10023141]|uniref:2-C-methyl-D-erythritol 4-phosphate cytidylyltransferase n=1 Tax=Pseudonocardia sp. GCM10023141 TaxID=3252653 RepID=UPI0036137F78
MNVIAVVVAGVRRAGPDALTELNGHSLLVHAVRGLLAAGVVERVHVLVDPGADPGPITAACSGLPVEVHAAALRHLLLRVGPHARQRAGATDGDGLVTPGSDAVVLLHDAARPLAPPALAAAVVAAVVAGAPAAVPVLPLADTVKRVDPDGTVRATPDRSALRVVQLPQAFRAELLADVADPLGAAAELAAAGVAVHTVAGDPLAFAVHTAWHLEQARLLAGRIVL